MPKRLIDKIEEDFNHGGKLGPKSTANVLKLLREFDIRIEALEQYRLDQLGVKK